MMYNNHQQKQRKQEVQEQQQQHENSSQRHQHQQQSYEDFNHYHHRAQQDMMQYHPYSGEHDHFSQENDFHSQHHSHNVPQHQHGRVQNHLDQDPHHLGPQRIQEQRRQILTPETQRQNAYYRSHFRSMARRAPGDRPLIKLSASLIDTYKQINKSYYEERDSHRSTKAFRASKIHHQQGLKNNGWDDENYDYIVTNGEVIHDRYTIMDRIGKGSFGQVFRAFDSVTNQEVAIKIIKSKKPFLLQAKTEIELLSSVAEKADQYNIVRLLSHFMYRNHQCLVFEMLSLNLYELLKNTQFNGVSLALIRKFAKQILKSLSYLGKPHVEIIHCDLKPENILLRHPKRSSVKIIDFGSSCKSNKRMYSYIQSRFYRSPEVILGSPYTVAIDIWSLGCILVEMHTGEPLFSGSDQFDQMHKIVKVLGMIPSSMIDNSSDQHRSQFFERNGSKWILKRNPSSNLTSSDHQHTQTNKHEPLVTSENAKASLAEVIIGETNHKKKYPQNDEAQSARNYELFIDLIYRMLCYDPVERITPDEALEHAFILEGEREKSGNTNPMNHHNSSLYSSTSNHNHNSISSHQQYPTHGLLPNQNITGQFTSSRMNDQQLIKTPTNLYNQKPPSR